MGDLLRRVPAGAIPLMVMGVLVAIERQAGDDMSAAGVLTGAAMMAVLVALGVRHGGAAAAEWRVAWRDALVSVVETAFGVALVFLLAAPMTVLLPRPWAIALIGSDRATDLMVSMLVGVGVLVAARAMRRATRQAAARAIAERDAATARSITAERERELARAELDVLRAQVEPHFLFNSLASLEYLIRTDPARALEMLGQLVAYLRTQAVTCRIDDCTLGTEFEAVRAYLGLMRIRMGERLEFELDLPSVLAAEPFPPLVLQTLVENAIKHGLEPKAAPGRLRVAARSAAHDAARLELEVSDDGVGLQPNPPTRGTRLGLANVRERLRALHGGAASLRIGSREGGGVQVRVDWPRNASEDAR